MTRLLATQDAGKTFTSGHSEPCLLVAEPSEGGEPIEVVVKFRTAVVNGRIGLCSELTAALLARALGLDAPRPFLVEITEAFVESVADATLRQRLGQNLGWQFATEYLSGN